MTYLTSFDYELIADALDVLDPDGSDATSRKQELEAWARQMAATGRGYLPIYTPELLRAATAMLHAFGGNVPDWLQPEVEALSRACADADGFPQAKPTRVLVALEGGCVQGIIADRAGVEAIVLDYDTEGTDDAELYAIPQYDGTTAEAIRSTWGAIECEPAFIDGAAAAPCVAAGELARCASCDEPRTESNSTHQQWQCGCCSAWNDKSPEELQLTETRADPLRHVEIADAD